jgi:hypothetical protein
MNGLNKLECYITLGQDRLARDKHSSLLGPFKSYKYAIIRMWLWVTMFVKPFFCVI